MELASFIIAILALGLGIFNAILARVLIAYFQKMIDELKQGGK